MTKTNLQDLKDISKKLIPDKVLEREVTILYNLTRQSINEMEKNFEENVIDPFSELFDRLFFNMKERNIWKNAEKNRQAQKTLTNHIGRFHQNLLVSLDGCKEPEKGGVDFICEKKKILAELKNKHNTVNSKSKAGAFDGLTKALLSKNDFKGYFVVITPKNNKNYEKILITTKNHKKSEYRKPNINILTINAESFYEKITGQKNILKSIFLRIPDITISIDPKLSSLANKIQEDKLFTYYLIKALGEFN